MMVALNAMRLLASAASFAGRRSGKARRGCAMRSQMSPVCDADCSGAVPELNYEMEMSYSELLMAA